MATLLALGALIGTAVLVGGLVRVVARRAADRATRRRRDLAGLVSFVVDSSTAPTQGEAIDAAAARLAEMLHVRSLQWGRGPIDDSIAMCLYPDGTVTRRLPVEARRGRPSPPPCLALCVAAGDRTFGHFEAQPVDRDLDVEAQLVAGVVLGHLAALLAALPDRSNLDIPPISCY